MLRRFITDRGKIRARRITGNCTQHQRDIATAVKKRARGRSAPLHRRPVTRTAPLVTFTERMRCA